MVNQAFDDPDIEEVITNVDTKQKTVKVCRFTPSTTQSTTLRTTLNTTPSTTKSTTQGTTPTKTCNPSLTFSKKRKKRKLLLK